MQLMTEPQVRVGWCPAGERSHSGWIALPSVSAVTGKQGVLCPPLSPGSAQAWADGLPISGLCTEAIPPLFLILQKGCAGPQEPTGWYTGTKWSQWAGSLCHMLQHIKQPRPEIRSISLRNGQCCLISHGSLWLWDFRGERVVERSRIQSPWAPGPPPKVVRLHLTF